jgi:hypothetical protein
MSHLLLEDVVQLVTQFPGRVHFLLGNHELAEMTDFPITKGNCMLNLQFRLGIDKFYGTQSAAIRRAYGLFLRSCPLAVRINHRVLVCHSLPEAVDRHGFDPAQLTRDLGEEDLCPHGPVFQLLWGRDFREANARAFAEAMEVELLVHGHVPCAEGFAVPNPYQIILDCSGSPARYLLLSLDPPFDQERVLRSLHPLCL